MTVKRPHCISARLVLYLNSIPIGLFSKYSFSRSLWSLESTVMVDLFVPLCSKPSMLMWCKSGCLSIMYIISCRASSCLIGP